MALDKAIDRYKHNQGFALSSYAFLTILGELKRHLRTHGWAVRPPRDLQELSLRVDMASARLTVQLDRAPTVPELADASGVSEQRVLEALQARAARGAVSLHAPANGHDDETVLQDTLGISDDGYARAEMRVLLDGLMNDVSPRAREILRLRFSQDLTQAEIGALIGVGEMQISRIVRKTIAQLRHIADAARMPADPPRPTTSRTLLATSVS